MPMQIMQLRQSQTTADMWRPSKILIQFIFVCLVISTTDSQQLECELYQRLFPACKCLKAEDSNAGVIDCSGLNLMSVPTANEPISDTIYEMRLNNNNIVGLTSSSFTWLKIRKLDLRGNRISTVDDNTFQSLAQITTILYIEGNGISSPPSGALNKLVNLRELSLGNYGLSILNTSMFIAFPNLQKLTLENWKLTSINSDAFLGISNLKSLILNNQNFDVIPVSVLNKGNLNSLKQLTISNTNIHEVTDHAFQNLANLEELDLSQNNINKLDILCFDGVDKSLKTVNLSGNILNNDVNDINLQGLKNLFNLTQLDLSSNERITSVPDLSQLNSFNSKVPLKLYLHNNKITNIDSLASYGKYLHTLDLSRNYFSSMDSIASLTSIVSLNLSNQSLPINWTIIKRLTTLEVLSLSSVGMTSVPDFVLEELIHLRVLDLSSANGDLHPNSFSDIQAQALVGPHSTLKELYLSGSHVTKLLPCLLDGYTSLNITMSLDNVICDCNIYWLWSKVRSGSISFLKGQEAKCKSSGKLLFEVQQTEFCSKPPSVQCTNYYFYPSPNVTLKIDGTKIQVSWTLSSATSNIKLLYFHVELDEDSKPIRQENVTIRTFNFSPLKNNTLYRVCVTAVYTTQSMVQCEVRKIPSSSQTDNQSGSNDSQKTGIIVGCVIGGVVLLAILAAIVYLLFIRRKPQQKSVNLPEQPRKFTTSELPTLTGESRSYAKKKKANGANQNDSNMQVVAISDGQTGPARVGRAQMINSQSSGGKPTSTSSVSSVDKATYENDRGALPKVPTPQSHTDQNGYINMGYKRDSYDEIDPKKETII